MRRLKANASRLPGARGGNFAVMTALSMPVAFALAAVAIDEGALYVERRELQSLTDLAAIAAAADPASAREIVGRMFADNGIRDAMISISGAGANAELGGSETLVTIEKGNYAADPARPVDARFVAGGTRPVNAVRVRAKRRGTLHFAQGWRPAPVIGVHSVASSEPAAAFSVGSRLARLDGGVANRLLGALTGSTLDLSIMDYEALVDADIELFAFLDALNTNLDLGAGTYSELLDAELSIGRLATELARIGSLDVSAVAALKRFAAAGSPSRFRLRQLLDIGRWSDRQAGAPGIPVAPVVSAMELLSAAALVSAANGDSQVEAGLDTLVPGLADLRLHLAVGELPQGSGWLRLTSAGDIVRTAQTRLLVVAELGGPGGILGASIRLPLYLELAPAEAQLAAISCTGNAPRVGIGARPGIAGLRLADVDIHRLTDFSRVVPLQPARLITLPAVTVTAAAHLAVASQSFTTLTFSASEIEDRKIKRVSTTSIAGSLTASLMDTLQLDVRLAGIDLGLGAILSGTLRGILTAAAPSLDNALLTVLATLGLSLGEADIRVHGASCGTPVLVQ